MSQGNILKHKNLASLQWAVVATALIAQSAFAQAPRTRTPARPRAAAERTPPPAAVEAEAAEEEAVEAASAPSVASDTQLRAPRLEMPTLDPSLTESNETDAEATDDDDDLEPNALPDPTETENRLLGEDGETTSSDPTAAPWTTPRTVFELHGYMRMRGDFQDQFFLGRGDQDPGGQTSLADLPFSLFRPTEDGVVPVGGCTRGSPSSVCDQNSLASANMRLRLEPTVHLSDDVRVRMQIDVFDNLVMGSTPDGYAVGPGGNDPFARQDSNYVPILGLSQTQTTPTYGRNGFNNSISARRAWAEVRNRGLGELRFGRMGSHWGLGIFQNDGRGIDGDHQTDVDRIMAVTRLAGYYVFGAWDFASEGFVSGSVADLGGVPYDRSRMDDVDQLVLGAARRSSPEEQRQALAAGDFVLNAGVYFVYRTQNLSTEATANPLNGNRPTYFRRGLETFTPDVWVQFLYDKLRLEIEAVSVLGGIDNACDTQAAGRPTSCASPRLNLAQLGVAFEGEYRMLNDQLGIHLHAGFASGDADSEGLTSATNLRQQQNTAGRTDNTASTFAFHPNYRVDLIFWRTIMRQIAGAYYFRPGLSYDFMRGASGQLLGLRVDAIWSRASEPVQTWGNNADLGLELDAQAYYRTEDGPDLLDGFSATVQGGIFFPFAGLGYLPGTFTNGTSPMGGQNAWTLRMILGVTY